MYQSKRAAKKSASILAPREIVIALVTVLPGANSHGARDVDRNPPIAALAVSRAASSASAARTRLPRPHPQREPVYSASAFPDPSCFFVEPQVVADE